MALSQSAEDSTEALVLSALENPKYVWRTLDGLKRDTQLPGQRVMHTLRRLPKDQLVTSRTAAGKRVYSTREHYRNTQSFVGKLLSAISDRTI